MIDNKPAMITVESPAHATFEVRPARDGDSGRFIFDKTDSPGLYTWRSAGAVIGYSNVQPPSSESELLYRAADSVFAPADNVIAARSLDEMRQKMAKFAEPEPKWSVPMALVLILLCVEALLGSLSGIRAKGPGRSSLGAVNQVA